MNIAFTGHREFDSALLAEPLHVTVAGLCREFGSIDFWCGMAVGFDLAAAEAVLAMKRLGADVKLHCVLPYPEQPQYFSPNDSERYGVVLGGADDVVTIEPEYTPMAFHRRNDYLVAHAELIIAYYNEDLKAKSGGTAYTMRIAKKAKLHIRNLYPKSQLSLF